MDQDETDRLVEAWNAADLDIPLKVIASPYREVTNPIVDYVKNIRSESPRDVVTVYIPEYVVGKWWQQILHNQSALRLKGRLLFTPGVLVTSVPYQLRGSDRAEERVERTDASLAVAFLPRTDGDRAPSPATGGVRWRSARSPTAATASPGSNDRGRVIFVRHALPGERVRLTITDDSHDRFWRADAVEILEPHPGAGRARAARSPGRVAAAAATSSTSSLAEQRRLKAAVVAEQLRRLAGLEWSGAVEEVSTRETVDGLHWRTRMRYHVDDDGRAGLRVHRSHRGDRAAGRRLSDRLAADTGRDRRSRWPPGSEMDAVAGRRRRGAV